MSRASDFAEHFTARAATLGLDAHWNIAPEKAGDEYVVFAFGSEAPETSIAGVVATRGRETIEVYVYARTAKRAADLGDDLVARLGNSVNALGGLRTAATETGYHVAIRQIVVSLTT